MSNCDHAPPLPRLSPKRPLWSHKQYPWCLHVRSVRSSIWEAVWRAISVYLASTETARPSTLSVDCTKDVNWWCHDLNPSLFWDWMKSSAQPSVKAPALQSCLSLFFLLSLLFSFIFIYWFVFCGSGLRGVVWEFLPIRGFNPTLSSRPPAYEKPPQTESTTLHVPTLKLHLAWRQTFKGLA